MSAPQNMPEKLHRQLQGEVGGIRVVSVSRLQDLENEILFRHKCGLFDGEFYGEQLSFFSFHSPAELPAARSLIVVVVPAPPGRVTFHWRAQAIALVLPPTYVGYRRTTERMKDRLAALLSPGGYQVAHTQLPLKLLAVRSGLAEYGRNNVVYGSGLGSYLQVCAYYSDLPCAADFWRESKTMERCNSCTACLQQCPTGAISSSRFLLHAERCITFHNERMNPLPTWLGVSWHQSLIGCLICQRACPENRAVRDEFVDRATFSEEETLQLLGRNSGGKVSPAILARWTQLGLTESLDLLMRNLAAILENRDTERVK
jgi:epoxyqueuosine reductase